MPEDAKIADNIEFRQGLRTGQLVVTQGVSRRTDVWEIVRQVRHYNSFQTNDGGQHDFGTFEMRGQRFFWQIEAAGRVPMASNGRKAIERVLIVGLAAEF